jgi:transcriptional regulator with XRE-family HTH domain
VSETLGKTIRILRQARDLTISEAARRSKISVPFLSLVESGARQPSISVLRRLAQTLRIPSEALLLSAMGAEGNLVAKDNETKSIAAAVQELVEIEDKLRKLLKGKGARGGTKGDNGDRHRGRDGS